VGALAAAAARRATGGSDAGEKLGRWLARRDAPSGAYDLARELFSPGTCEALLGGAQAGAQAGADERGTLPADPVNAVSCLELERYMRNQLLRDTDVMSMAHGLEVRVPFLDHRLVEAVAPLPGARKRRGRGAGPKPLLVGALGGLLPPEVVERRKMGFTLPFADWLRGPLRAEVEGALADGDRGGRIGRLLDADAVRAVWTRFAEGGGHWSRPWALYVLKRWGEAHLP
jgi:asparagine synthase (glutamine-hydrolysing)